MIYGLMLWVHRAVAITFKVVGLDNGIAYMYYEREALPLGGSGGMPPKKNLRFWALSDRF